MKKFLTLAALPAALIGLGACSTYDGGYGYSSYGYSDYGYNTGYSDYGYSPGYSSGIWYDAYYDDFYGPVYGGYWASDGYFWYQSRIGGSYVRDHARHFRRDHHNGYKAYRYQDNRGGNRGNWDRDRNDRNTYPPLFSGQRNDRDRDRDRGNDRNGNGGRDNNPRANPAPGGGQWNGGDRNRDRDGDRGRNNNGNGGNANGGRGGGSPPLFSGQQPPRANPDPAPQLDGAPRGDRGNDNRGRRNDGGDRARDNGDRGGGSPPLFRGQRDQQQAAPAPAPQQREARPQQQRSDGDRGNRGGGDNRYNRQGRDGGNNKERGRDRKRD